MLCLVLVEKLEAAIENSSTPVEKLDLLSIIPPQEMQPLRHNEEAAQKSESELPTTAPKAKMA